MIDRIDRRAFTLLLGATAIAGVAPAYAQVPGRVYRMAVLAPAAFPAEEIDAVVLPELATLGFERGRNLDVTVHVGSLADLPRLAAAAIATKPDVVVVSTNAAVSAVLAVSRTVPIVMAFAGDDPIKAGIAKSLARPGGSVTGLTNQAPELDGKNVSLLHEAAPAVRRLGILAIPPPRHVDSIAEIERAAGGLRIETTIAFAHDAAAYPAAFAAMRAAGCGGLILASCPEYARDAKIIAAHALEAGLPGIGEFPAKARDGLLIGYGTNTAVFRRRAAHFVARILLGTPPGEIAIEQPSVYQLAINLKTAKALGLTIPPILLLRADEVIE